MQKEHERREKMNGFSEEEKKKMQEEHEKQQAKHANHPRIHHPVC